MIFGETALPGVFVIEIEKRVDDRGFFARTFCAEEFAAAGLETAFPQCNISYSRARGLLRGLHYQTGPDAEAKLVRCTHGAVYDVAVDLRRESPAYCRWFGIELAAESGRQIYIPRGCAHGFITLCDDTELSYQISMPYAPDAGAGARWDDPAFTIDWPMAPLSMSERDRDWPDYVLGGDENRS